jgi:2-dehydro-3-deoxyphosphogluconate aldolase/(4S)-4-hydroxy-2-oxoglutarate aldolase
VLTPKQLAAVERQGACFGVSPGATEALLDAAVPLLPGAGTASEVMRLVERGYRQTKFFPAESAGGIAYLKALATLLSEARFCPTGGIDAVRASAWLALPNVICVGGSWVAPPDAVSAGD